MRLVLAVAVIMPTLVVVPAAARMAGVVAVVKAEQVVQGGAPPAAGVPPPGGTAPRPAEPRQGPPVGSPTQAAPPGVPPTPPVAPAARTFTAPVGMLFNAVRPDKVADFEKVLAYLQAAIEKATNPTTVAQARGWRFFKGAEPGPNNTVLYVFVLDPTVPGADYGLSQILADAYPDTAQLQEIWRLYTSSVTSGGSILNLTAVKPALSALDLTPVTPGSTLPAPETTPRMLPPNPNEDPNRRPDAGRTP